MKKALLILIIFININTLSGQYFEPKISNTFFSLMKNHGISEGIEYLYSTNQWLKKEIAAKENLQQKCESLLSEQQVGKYVGHRLLYKQSLGRTLTSISYIVNYERQPYRFTFILYRPDRKREWRLQEFYFDNELIDELVERGKLYMLSDDDL